VDTAVVVSTVVGVNGVLLIVGITDVGPATDRPESPPGCGRNRGDTAVTATDAAATTVEPYTIQAGHRDCGRPVLGSAGRLRRCRRHAVARQTRTAITATEAHTVDVSPS
jgi:hypothetical protein